VAYFWAVGRFAYTGLTVFEFCVAAFWGLPSSQIAQPPTENSVRLVLQNL